MMIEIEMFFGDFAVLAELDDTPTGRKIAAALPLQGEVHTWGEEIYFDIPVQATLEGDAREELFVGELAFWPPGQAFCVFFGPTPASRSGEPRAYSPVNVVGRLLNRDLVLLRGVKDGARVRVSAAPETQVFDV